MRSISGEERRLLAAREALSPLEIPREQKSYYVVVDGKAREVIITDNNANESEYASFRPPRGYRKLTLKAGLLAWRQSAAFRQYLAFACVDVPVNEWITRDLKESDRNADGSFAKIFRITEDGTLDPTDETESNSRLEPNEKAVMIARNGFATLSAQVIRGRSRLLIDDLTSWPFARSPLALERNVSITSMLSISKEGQLIVVRDVSGREIGRLRAEIGAKVSIEQQDRMP